MIKRLEISVEWGIGFMKKIAYIIYLFLCSCYSQPDAGLKVWNYDDFVNKSVKMSDIADKMTIIQPDSIDYQGSLRVHSSFFSWLERSRGS